MDEWNKRGIKIENIILNSNGGDVNAALAISQYILNKDINIYVLENHICASSCFMILAAGNQKFLSDKGKIGVHRISANSSENKKNNHIIRRYGSLLFFVKYSSRHN
ncbi:ATP-dependent Clp protease proteolytic subunit [Mannheimia granulomatis]|nr:ATP-dependent Clp protease proteolytic subunit [Mannheimia granulomatis]